MIETLDEMPPGTLGFRATGKVTGDEYRDVLLPAMRAAAEAGEVRMVFVVGPGFEGFEPGTLLEDAKTGLTLGFGNLSAWKRTALVTDVEWISKAFHLFAWMAPGEVMIRGLDGLDEAKAWVAG
jgi:SpoIIAA-like